MTIDKLNTLIETCKDGEYGFRACAEHVKSRELKSVFLSRADGCQRGATELQALVARSAARPTPAAASAGTMHRGWVSVVGTLTGHSDQAMLDECERGEDVALERYRGALKEPLPADVMTRGADAVRRRQAQPRPDPHPAQPGGSGDRGQRRRQRAGPLARLRGRHVPRATRDRPCRCSPRSQSRCRAADVWHHGPRDVPVDHAPRSPGIRQQRREGRDDEGARGEPGALQRLSCRQACCGA